MQFRDNLKHILKTGKREIRTADSVMELPCRMHYLRNIILLLLLGLAIASGPLRATEFAHLYDWSSALFPDTEAGDPRLSPYIKKIQKQLLSLCASPSASKEIKGIPVKKGITLFEGDTLLECRGTVEAPVLFLQIKQSGKPYAIALLWVSSGKPIMLPRPAPREHTSLADGEIFTFKSVEAGGEKKIIVVHEPSPSWRQSLPQLKTKN